MYKIIYVCLVIVWVMDILNFPFMAFMDVEVPMNFLGVAAGMGLHARDIYSCQA